MICPVWVSAWHFDDGDPDLALGDRCLLPLTFNAGDDPLWSPTTPALGRVELDLRKVTQYDVDGDVTFVYGARSLRLFSETELLPGPHVGSIHAELDQDERWACPGVVTAIEVVPVRYELVSDRSYQPVEYLLPISVQSTRERNSLVPYPHPPGDVVDRPTMLLSVDFD